MLEEDTLVSPRSSSISRENIPLIVFPEVLETVKVYEDRYGKRIPVISEFEAA